jgi:2'-5' RNA ligase
VQLGFVILLPDEVHNAVRRWQLEIAEVCGRNPALKQHPHITLKQPFHARELAPIERYFDELALSAKPMPIEIDGVGSFEQDEVVFLDVHVPAELETLRVQVLEELRSRFSVKPRDIEDSRYRFHVTLAYSLQSGAFPRAWDTVKDAPAKFSFKTEAFGLFYYTGEEWILYKVARLARSGR